MSLRELDDATRESLLLVARHAIERELHVREGAPDPGPPPRTLDAARRSRAAFVTLKTDEPPRLRGCIGTLEPEGPLDRTVARYARHAALDDPRFPPLRAEEWPRVAVSISVLAPARPVTTEEEIEPGTHGVILERDGKRAVFLPQVATEQGWDRTTLLEHLARKAGLPRDAWRGAHLALFETENF